MNIEKRFYDSEDLDKKYGKLSVGAFLRAWRLSEGWSQKIFARKLKISAANLCDIEKGRKGVSVEKAQGIAKAIGYPPTVLVQMALQDEVSSAGLKYSVRVKSAA